MASEIVRQTYWSAKTILTQSPYEETHEWNRNCADLTLKNYVEEEAQQSNKTTIWVNYVIDVHTDTDTGNVEVGSSKTDITILNRSNYTQRMKTKVSNKAALIYANELEVLSNHSSVAKLRGSLYKCGLTLISRDVVSLMRVEAVVSFGTSYILTYLTSYGLPLCLFYIITT